MALDPSQLHHDSQSQSALAAIPALRGVDEIEAVRVDRDPLGMTHTRVRQVIDGVPVYGGDGIVHQREDGTLAGLTDRFLRYVNVVDITPSLDEVEAIALAVEDRIPEQSVADLWVYRGARFGRDHLVWRVRSWDLRRDNPTMPVAFVDAHTGEVLFRYDNLQTARDRDTYSANNGTNLPGVFKRGEGDAAIGDIPLDAAHDFAGDAYDYYDLEQDRDSWDANGATIKSVAHYSTSYDNAFWDGAEVVYGDGGFFFKPLSLALDVVAHELTHAVTERSSSLDYFGESGGLNEATSDIMGAVIESYANGGVVDADTWLVGEDIVKAAGFTFLRSMSNPPADGVSIDDYDNYFAGMDVHFSSGIANKAFYKFVGTDLTLEEAGDIWYRASLYYMTRSTTFPEAREATEQAAIDLYGPDSPELADVSAAWEVVDVPDAEAVVEFDSDGPLALNTNASSTYAYTPASDATAVWFTSEGATGDADIYVSFNKIPSTVSADCTSNSADSYEICNFEPSSSGVYNVKIVAASTFSDVTIRAWQHRPCHDDDSDGVTDCDGDCDDGDDAVFPTATELCNGVDDDCDAVIDLDAVDISTWYADADLDTYGDPAVSVTGCDAPAGFVLDDSDCDDDNAGANPGVAEFCNGYDDDCDGKIDGPGVPGSPTWHPDLDQDGFGNDEIGVVQCGAFFDWILDGTDCDDDDDAVNPDAAEVCDPADVDEDCDGLADGPNALLQTVVYADGDGDGFGTVPSAACDVKDGFAAVDGDCEDADGLIYPGRPEVCDGVDQDCDVAIDEDAIDAPTWYVDADADGYGAEAVEACAQPPSTNTADGDCDDDAVDVYPGAPELAGDGIDQDCDGADLPVEDPDPTEPTEPTDPTDPPGTTTSPEVPAPPVDDTASALPVAECGCAAGDAPLGAPLAWAIAALAVTRRRRAR